MHCRREFLFSIAIATHMSIRRYVVDFKQVIHYLRRGFVELVDTLDVNVCYKISLSRFLNATGAGVQRLGNNWILGVELEMQSCGAHGEWL